MNMTRLKELEDRITELEDDRDLVEELERRVTELEDPAETKTTHKLPTWTDHGLRSVRRITHGGWDDLRLVEWVLDVWPQWEQDAWLKLSVHTPREKRIAKMVRRVCTP